MTYRGDAQRLLRLCAAAETAGAWVEVLRDARDEIAIANHGTRLTIQVVMTPDVRVRFGITATGRIVHPLPGDREPDLRVEGEADDVAAFLLGQYSLAEAEERGLVSMQQDLVEGRIERLRSIVAEKLTALLDGNPRLLPIGVALSARTRRWWGASADLTAAGMATLAPAMASIAMLVLPAAHPAPPVVEDPVVTVAESGDVSPPLAAKPTLRSIDTGTTRSGPSVRSGEPRPGTVVRPGGAAPASVTISTGIGGTAPGEKRTVNLPVSGELECGGRIREAMCDAVERLPRPAT